LKSAITKELQLYILLGMLNLQKNKKNTKQQNKRKAEQQGQKKDRNKYRLFFPVWVRMAINH
jgi:hypothetical protein